MNGHSSATNGISLARKARLRPLASHTRLMAEAAASATSHWPTLAESAVIHEGGWPWGRRADGDPLDDCSRAQELERSAWLRRDAARRRRRASRLEAEAVAIDGSWSQVRRDAFNETMARFDGLESRFDSRPDVRRLVEQVVAKMRDLRAAMSTLAASGSPEQQAIAVAVQKRAEELLRQVGVTAVAALQS